MNNLELIAIRDANPDDKNFIFATWLRGLRHGNDFFNTIDKTSYFKTYHSILENLLISGVTIKIACLKEDPSVILGYSVYKDTRLDWVFIKKAWREIGIAKSLIPTVIHKVTHLTRVGKSILLKYPHVVFDPFDS